MKYIKPHYGVTRPFGSVATPQQLIWSQKPEKEGKKTNYILNLVLNKGNLGELSFYKRALKITKS